MEPTSKPRRRLEPPPPKSRRKTLLWTVGGAGLAVTLLGLYFFFFLSPSSTHNELPVTFPPNAPRGDVVPVKYGVKAGDLFETKVKSDTHFITVAEEKIDVKDGMAFTVQLTVTQEVTASATGGLASKQQIFIDNVDTHVASLRTDLLSILDHPRYRYGVTFDRDATGRPVRTSIVATKAWPGQRFALDGLFSGLADLPTNALPSHDVRLGETWELAETMDVPGIEDVVRYFAQRNTRREGFPAAKQKAVVHADALESKDGEECLKLHILLTFSVEGDVVPPAMAGFISTAARIDGFYWVSLSTGLVWAIDMTSDIFTSYLVPNHPTERKATGRITATTKRVEFLRK